MCIHNSIFPLFTIYLRLLNCSTIAYPASIHFICTSPKSPLTLFIRMISLPLIIHFMYSYPIAPQKHPITTSRWPEWSNTILVALPTLVVRTVVHTHDISTAYNSLHVQLSNHSTKAPLDVSLPLIICFTYGCWIAPLLHIWHPCISSAPPCYDFTLCSPYSDRPYFFLHEPSMSPWHHYDFISYYDIIMTSLTPLWHHLQSPINMLQYHRSNLTCSYLAHW